MRVLHEQHWAAVLTPRPRIPGSKHSLAKRNLFLSHPVCSDWISILAIMTNSPCQQWLITCPGCRHQPRGGDLLGWYWVGQRGIWTWRWWVLHGITNLFHNPLSHAQIFSVLPVTFLLLFTKETINTNASMHNFWGQETFFIAVFLMATRLFLQNNHDFQQVNSSSLYLSALLKLLCLPLFLIT